MDIRRFSPVRVITSEISDSVDAGFSSSILVNRSFSFSLNALLASASNRILNHGIRFAFTEGVMLVIRFPKLAVKGACAVDMIDDVPG